MSSFPGFGGRVLVAVPGIALFLAVILFLGPGASLALFALLSALAGFEASGLCLSRPPLALRAAVGASSALFTWLTGTGSPLALPGLLLPGLALAPWWLFRRGPRDSRSEMLGTLSLTVFYALGFGVLAMLSTGWENRVFVLLPLVTCWTGDTFAYLAGCRWGRHRMLPEVSPAKSWEGFAAGMAGSVAAAVVLGYGRLPLVQLAVTGLACGIAGVLGDLLESAVKRDAGKKDSGSLLAGHGGILDRFDSVAAAAPAALAMVILFGSG